MMLYRNYRLLTRYNEELQNGTQLTISQNSMVSMWKEENLHLFLLGEVEVTLLMHIEVHNCEEFRLVDEVLKKPLWSLLYQKKMKV
jgi:hypothetical protein